MKSRNMDDRIFIAIMLALLALCGGRPRIQQCTSSLDCPVRFCCRDDSGNLINGEAWGSNLESAAVNGTCRRGTSKPGGACTDRCGCGRGYTCYRTIMGVCCPPTTCWEAKEAAKDKAKWDECLRRPDCPLPPVANPGR